MTISPLFQAELAAVDATKAFSFELDPSFGTNEWSVSGFHVTGGSEAAQEHGASETLYRLGFRFYDPLTTVRPASLPEGGVSLPRQQFLMPYVRVFENYGRGKLAEEEHYRWRTLNCVDDRRRPVGHSWGTIINAIQAEDGFFSQHPTYLIQHVNGPIAFNVGLQDAERAQLVERVASYLANNLNEENRHHFDPEDGDKYSTDEVIDFSNEVVAKLRETVPDALLGVYAYAGHREPPTNPCPHLYIQVALGFNDLGIGYQALVRRWAEKAGEVALRGYGDIAAWDGYLPCNSAITRSNFFTGEYKGYLASGADSLNMETSGNWIKNNVSHYHMIRYLRDGVTSYFDVLTEMVENVFEGDPKVTELFEFWGDPTNRFNAFTLLKSMQIVQGMRDSEYKARFERHLTISYHHWDLTPNHANNGEFRPEWDDRQKAVYFRKLEQNLRRVHALGITGHFHSYGYERQLANVNVSRNGRPDLRFSNAPHWQRYPQFSNHEDFQDALASLSQIAGRPDHFDQSRIDDLVIVDTLPEGQAATFDGDAVDFVTEGPARFVFSGPGTVTVDYTDDWLETEVTSFGPGLHSFAITSAATTRWNGGLLFLGGFPEVRLDPPNTTAPPGGGHRWMYIPRIVQGGLRLSSESRLTIYDVNGRMDIIGDADQSVTPGVARVDKANTRGVHKLITANPYFSCSAYKMLMPRKLAEAEFPAGVTVRKAS